MIKTGLDPIVDENSQILILGTFPSAKSLKKKEYYGNNVNQFWKILSAVYGLEEPRSYADKTRIILQNRLALWDVYKCAVREGSADINIVEGKVNDFYGFLRAYPHIKGILFGSKGAEKLFAKSYSELYHETPHVTAFSPSSAYPKKIEEKIVNWTNCIKLLKELMI